MKKSHIIAAVLVLIGSLMAAIGLSSPTQAAPAAVSYDTSKVEAAFKAGDDCRTYVSFDYETESYQFGLSNVYYGVEVHFRNCAAPAADVSRRTQILSFVTLCKSDGPGPDPNWMHTNLYFYDKDGHSYNPTYKEMECPDQVAYNEKTYYSASDQWFHKCAAGPPRWNAELKVSYPAGYGEDVHSIASTFWGFDGLGKINC